MAFLGECGAQGPNPVFGAFSHQAGRGPGRTVESCFTVVPIRTNGTSRLIQGPMRQRVV